MIILECEDVRKRTLFEFHKKIISSIENPRVLVIPWTTEDKEKLERGKELVKKYFEELGAEVKFLGGNFKEKFEWANVLYLPGGNTEILLKKLKENPEVIEMIKNFKGIIIGNSAGAIALSRAGYGHKEEKLIRYEGLGVVDVKIIVHFKPEDLKEVKGEDIIGIPDDCAVVLPERSMN